MSQYEKSFFSFLSSYRHLPCSYPVFYRLPVRLHPNNTFSEQTVLSLLNMYIFSARVYNEYYSPYICNAVFLNYYIKLLFDSLYCHISDIICFRQLLSFLYFSTPCVLLYYNTKPLFCPLPIFPFFCHKNMHLQKCLTFGVHIEIRTFGLFYQYRLQYN